MFKLAVDTEHPLMSLEACRFQISMVTDLMSGGESRGVELSDEGAAGLCDLLRGINGLMGEIMPMLYDMQSAASAAPASAAPVAPKLTEPRPATARRQRAA